jgi:hypothetical protein
VKAAHDTYKGTLKISKGGKGITESSERDCDVEGEMSGAESEGDEGYVHFIIIIA